jgi:hypothetical protein
VDTAAEKLTETVSRQKFTASETTHNNEYRIHAITTEKCRRRVSRQETWRSRRTVCLSFFIWMRRVLRRVIAVYVPCFFYTFFFYFSKTGPVWALEARHFSAPQRERASRRAPKGRQALRWGDRGSRASQGSERRQGKSWLERRQGPDVPRASASVASPVPRRSPSWGDGALPIFF